MLALGVDLTRDAITLALVEIAGRMPRLVGSWREQRDPEHPAEAQLRALIARHCPQRPDA